MRLYDSLVDFAGDVGFVHTIDVDAVDAVIDEIFNLVDGIFDTGLSERLRVVRISGDHVTELCRY